jgi:hypothetical protein
MPKLVAKMSTIKFSMTNLQAPGHNWWHQRITQHHTKS